ncbi:PP2C family protein-serine/threonine phosphatase [Streptomyces endophyticus]|uniref:Serine/threonine-protein phosphatase n=1 Tax=Streptomyces endophyticus TaxID=714166 RepID=A0ABU6FAA3_9ACTN|nr:PP2C family protein-serine/threonine phosphatase [Streptomyces endophyticus]MEB8340759.1 serine/threonine-protein phosphatase [Streptomyces endophyticus]
MAMSRGWRVAVSRRLTGNRLALTAAVVGSALVAALDTMADGWTPGAVALLIGPLLVCAHLGTRRTAAVAAWSLVLALGAAATHQRVAPPDFAAQFLALLAGSALAVRNAARHTAVALALARTTEVARVSQRALLRPVSVQFGGVTVRTRHHCPIPGSSTGGDLYDIVHTPYGARLLIGDVRGHGLDALGTAAATIGAFRDLAYLTPALGDLAEALDARISPDLGPEDFVTAIFAEFAPGEVRLVNCGHPAPVRLGKQIRLLEPPECALPLGLHPTPRPHRVFLQNGDRLLFYTDGLTEARDANGTVFPLLDQVGDALAAPAPSDALDALYDRVTAHADGPLTDDLALVLCQLNEQPLGSRSAPRTPSTPHKAT